MPDLLSELTRLGHVARVRTLRARGVTHAALHTAFAAGLVTRPRRGWVASTLADRDQLIAIAVGARIGCSSALRRLRVWSGVDDGLHLHVPRTASRLQPAPENLAVSSAGVWHPSVLETKRRGRKIRLASDDPPHVHWTLERSPRRAFDWIVSPQTALAQAMRCMDAEHASAAIDSALHEGVVTRRETDAILAALPNGGAGLVDRFTGRLESGVESLFVRRMSRAGFHIEPQVDLVGFGRYDGMIDGCVLFEVDGREFHSGSDEFFADRDRTLIAQSFGIPVVRPSARHVLEEWPMTFGAVVRTVEDAKLVRRHRGLPPIVA
jgi:hypothetical protein